MMRRIQPAVRKAVLGAIYTLSLLVWVGLVADTAGTSTFWRLVAKAQSKDFAQANPEPRFHAYDPGARPQILTERFNAAPVMPLGGTAPTRRRTARSCRPLGAALRGRICDTL